MRCPSIAAILGIATDRLKSKKAKDGFFDA
jgi:hypothetical protein